MSAEPVAAFHILRRPGKEQLAKAQARDEHVGLMDLAGLDLIPLDRIAGVIDFDPFCGLELAGGDRRLAVLRELAVKLLPEVRVRDERFRSFLPDKFHRVAEAEFMDDHWPFELRHPQRVRARRRLVRKPFTVADLAHQSP
ncbi:MAG: hypothetical protein ABSG30_03655 [Steroidobacteraceae bacterium]